MKKALLALLAAVLLAGTAYVVFFMKDEGPETVLVEQREPGQAGREPGSRPELNVRRRNETAADVQESLDYELGKNQDTVGWLRVPGTQIDNSVLQAHDNLAYLRRDERGRDSVYGCYFADYECSVGGRDALSANTVIYGHSDLKDNPDGPRFSQLFRFAEEDFARGTPVIQFSTLEAFMDWQVFAVFFTDTGFDYIQADPGPEAMAAVVSAAKEKSLYDYGVEVGPEDRILTLSTCTVIGGDDSHRFVVMAKLLPEDASPPGQAEIKPKRTEEGS